MRHNEPPAGLVTTLRTTSLAVSLACMAVVLQGCGVHDPYDGKPPRVATATTPSVPPSRIVTGPTDAPLARRADPPETVVPVGPKTTPMVAVRDFAMRWTSWSWHDPDGQNRALVTMATGRLAAVLGERRLTPADRASLQRERKASVGAVEAIRLRDGNGEVRRALVVVRVKSYAAGSPVEGGLHWSVFQAAARRLRGGWKVARWEQLP